MKSSRRSSAPLPSSSSRSIEHPGTIALPVGLKIARGKGLNIDHLASAPFPAWTQNKQAEATPLRSDFAGRVGPTENGPTHTAGHIDCPACQAFDGLVKADLLGMANQTFEDAAVVWQRVRRNSNALRERSG